MKELRSKVYALPNYPEEANTDEENWLNDLRQNQGSAVSLYT
ncbi:hypothetical protein O9993_18375 [Vibrio lentus]|nr:hypothetical protein [Vibrio lentus]